MNENIIRELALTARGIPDEGEQAPTQEQIYDARVSLETAIRREQVMIHSGPCKLVALTLGSLDYITLTTGNTLEGKYLAYDLGVI